MSGVNKDGRQLISQEQESESVDKTDETEGFEKHVVTKLLANGDDHPYAHTVEIGPGDVIPRHYHKESQWQVIIGGSCTIEGEEVEPITIQYTDTDTPYGPMVAGEDGLKFLTLRPTGNGRSAVMDL